MAGHPPYSAVNPRRILVRGVNWLGDAVMTTPALLRLRERFPDAEIVILTPEKLANLWRDHPAVDEVIYFEPGEGVISVANHLRTGPFQQFVEHRPKRREAGRAAYQEAATTGGTLAQAVGKVVIRMSEDTVKDIKEARNQAFDLALVLPNSPRSALEVFLARIPQRIGYARPWRNIFLTHAIPPRAGAMKMHKRTPAEIKAAITSPGQASRVTHHASAHQIHEYLHLVAALGANPEPLAPLLFVKHEEVDAARKKFGLETSSGLFFGLNAGAEYGPAKRWPADRFIAVARQIQSKTNCIWLLFGGKGDVTTNGQIAALLHAAHVPYHDLAGKTSLRELMALLTCCAVLLTNDTGPMHVAAALGRPVVVPFGSTSPELTGPGLPGDPRHQLLKSNAPCAPCFLRECPIDLRCMNGIGVERMVDAVLQVTS